MSARSGHAPGSQKFSFRGRSDVNPSASALSQPATKRAFNFNPGPAAIPLSVLERVRDELLDYRGTGMSVMEMSHRSPEFEAINDRNRSNRCAAFSAFPTTTPCCSCKAAAACSLPWCR